MLRREERAKNSLESSFGTRKTSKTSDPPKTIQINNNDKTQSHKSSPSPEIVELDDNDMDTEDLNRPLTTNNIDTTIESRIGLDKASAESF